FIGGASGAAALGLLGLCCGAHAQPARGSGQPDLSRLPPAPPAQGQRAQASVPGLPAPAAASGLTWDEVKAKFEAANPELKSDQANVEEMKAEEITAYL